MKIIYLLGTDGAGKTTVTLRLMSELAVFRGNRARYLYCQHRPLLLWLLKLPARLLLLRGANQFEDYSKYKQRKNAAGQRHPRLLRLYSWCSYLDVWLQVWPRMLWARLFADVLVLDRYYLDWVVNIGVLQDNDSAAMFRAAENFERTLPRGSLHIFLDVSEETAFRRKDDIQSVEYLRERKTRYLVLAKRYGFLTVDADQGLDAVVAQVAKLVTAHLSDNSHA